MSNPANNHKGGGAMVKVTVVLEAQKRFTVEHEDGNLITWQPGERKTLPLREARQIAHSMGETVHVLDGHAQKITGVFDSTPIQPGDWIVWTRTKNLPMYSGEVEVIQVDAGTTWLFVALPDEEFTMVNLQDAERVDEDA
jgi:hypothetical protein